MLKRHCTLILITIFALIINSCGICPDILKKGVVLSAKKNEIQYSESDGSVTVSLMKDGTYPKWDPKVPGRYAFIREGKYQSPKKPDNALCIATVSSTASSPVKILTPGWGAGRHLCWNPDGQWIFFEYKNPVTKKWDIWKVSPDGKFIGPINGIPKGLNSAGPYKWDYGKPAISYDGNWMACEKFISSEESTIIIWKAKGYGAFYPMPPSISEIIVKPKGYTDENPVWHHNKNVLAFTRGRTFGDNQQNGTVYLAMYDGPKYKWNTYQFTKSETIWRYNYPDFCSVCKKGKWDDLLVFMDSNGVLCVQPFALIKTKSNPVPFPTKTLADPVKLLKLAGWGHFDANPYGCIFTYPAYVPGSKGVYVENTHKNNTWDLYKLSLVAEKAPVYYKVFSMEKLHISVHSPHFMTWPDWK